MGYPCAHAFRHQVIPLSVNDFDQHWWLITDEYEDVSNHRKRALLEHVLAVPETEIRDPVQVRTRGRPSSSTKRLPSKLEHVTAFLDAPVHRRRCRKCQKTGDNARSCRQKATEAPTALTTLATPATVDLDIDLD
ncbi:unnamed protein product [Albugo candida]|uniref:Uncharacterized protein n=1 Tax=Albugo candida TaxID=65357 RepID=A0A024FXD7_9STRA|nr:unnamed protein product [Albugo candida]|eukprot:CCI11686.1 unnamed protein product [Albugo candida]